MKTTTIGLNRAPGREDYSLKFVTTANATKHLNIGRSNLGVSGITGKLVFEASVYSNDRNLERRFQLRSLNSDSTTTNKDVITFATNGNILDVNKNPIGQYQPNTWQNFKIFIDNENKASNLLCKWEIFKLRLTLQIIGQMLGLFTFINLKAVTKIQGKCMLMISCYLIMYL